MFPSPDSRGWVGISVVGLTVMVLWMVAAFPELRQDEFFKVLATAIVITGFIQGVVGWAYTATKQGGELADKAASIVQQKATEAAPAAAIGDQVEDGARAGTRQGVNDALNGQTNGQGDTDPWPSK